jgi:hypothetical protein
MTHRTGHHNVSMLVLVQSRNLEVQHLAGLDPQAPELVPAAIARFVDRIAGNKSAGGGV